MLSLFLSVIEDRQNDSKFEQLYNEYHDMMFRIAVGITRDFHDAEDALQMAFFAIAENIADVKTDNIPMLKSYLYKIVKSAAIDVLRSKKHVSELINLDELFDLASQDDVGASMEDDEQYQKIVQQVRQMPSLYRDVLVLHYLHEMSARQIAHTLRRKPNTVKQQLNRGTKILQAILRTAGLHE